MTCECGGRKRGAGLQDTSAPTLRSAYLQGGSGEMAMSVGEPMKLRFLTVKTVKYWQCHLIQPHRILEHRSPLSGERKHDSWHMGSGQFRAK